MTRRHFLAVIPSGLAPSRAGAAAPPKAFGAVPTDRQLRWHELETTAFLHFTVNTFTGKEWGYGDEDPNLFHPAAFDADAIVRALAGAGMRGVILTCKHHDGFCLWPTKTTDHSIRNSSWMSGEGDVVRDLSGAALRNKLAFGVYLSPWDRNNPHYGTPEYIAIYRRQLTELLTGYGPIFEVWHDGANGGDGFYGGAREKRVIDKNTYYDWPGTWELVRSLQPEAVIFSDVGPDIRWVGNEKGIAGDPCWAAYDPAGADGGPASPGNVRERESTTGHRNGSKWLPAECDVSIRPGWFWHESENSKVKTPAQLIDLYYKSVGRGANLLLNVPPNRDGLLEKEDLDSVKAFGEYRRRTFSKNLAAQAKATASNIRGKDRSYTPKNLLDGKNDTYWATDDDVRAAEVTFDLGRSVSFQVIRIREAIRFGQRIDAGAVDRWNDGAWEQLASATGIGCRRLIRLDGPVTATRVRLRVTQASASPILSEFALFSEPSLGEVLYEDDFSRGLARWVAELEEPGLVEARNSVLNMDVPAGGTLWFKPELSGPVVIEYEATMIEAGGANDRVSDLNCFWMATDSRSPEDIFATRRTGKFAEYDQLRTYYAGQGGNSNTTTRFRRYIGTRDVRPLLPEHDLKDAQFLLRPNTPQTIRLVANGNRIQYYRDGRLTFNFVDPDPYTRGHFAFRTTASHIAIRNFRVYRPY